MRRAAALCALLWACGACEPKPAKPVSDPTIVVVTPDPGGDPCAGACARGRRLCGEEPEHPDGGTCEDGCAALADALPGNQTTACREAAATCADWRACQE